MNKDLAFIEYEIGSRLLSKLADLSLEPKQILNLSYNPSLFTPALQDLKPLHIKDINSPLEIPNFASQSFDLIFANCCLPIANALPDFFLQVQRVLLLNGLVLFATFGPDTLLKLGLNNQFADMHNIGDLLVQQNYKDPVIDMERINLDYMHKETFFNDMQNLFEINIEQINITFPCQITFEIVYGFAYKQKTLQYKDDIGNTYISVDSITYI